jgi:hypothetical protein
MHERALVLPEQFRHPRDLFHSRAATGPDIKRVSVAFLRTASLRRGAFAECQAGHAHALFAKTVDADSEDTSNPPETSRPNE